MVRRILAAALIVPVVGCTGGTPNPPCTKTGVDPYGAPVCPLSAAQVQALPEASLIYPGSTVVYSNAEPGSLNVNGEPEAADVYAAFNTSASPATVAAWYEKALQTAGWIHISIGVYEYIRRPPISSYCEFYEITVLSVPPKDSPAPAPPAGGSYYEFRLTVPSTPSNRVTSPDASGQVHSVWVPCGGG